MGIKVSHTHPDGTVCYVVKANHKLTKKGVFRFGQHNLVGGYMAYTGHWYFYDPETGVEVASIHEPIGQKGSIVENMRVGDLVENPECVAA